MYKDMHAWVKINILELKYFNFVLGCLQPQFCKQIIY